MERVHIRAEKKIGSTNGRARLLLIEDDPNIQRLVVGALERTGCSVAVAETAADGLDQYRAGGVDLILLDIGLPDGSGFDLCRRIRAEEERRIPILFMTVQDDLSSRVRGFKAGGQDFILKPFHLEELVARVRVHLGISRGWRSLNSLNDELKTRDRNRIDLIDMIVHDLKSPLTAINGNLYLIGEEDCTAWERDKLLRNSVQAVKSMGNLIDDLLKVGQSVQGLMESDGRIISVSTLAQEVCSSFEDAARQRGIRLESSIHPGGLMVFSDHQLLSRILTNLIANAIKCAPPGEEILLECGVSSNKVRFVVSDRGPGVPDRDKKSIFVKFERLGKGGVDAVRGYGIGLFFCRSAAAALRGKVWVEDRLGGGARFILEIPDAIGRTYE